jgi:hypothetical protein
MLCKWFTAMCSEGKALSGLMIIERAKSFCGEIKITDKCTFSDGWLQSNKKLPVRNLVSVCAV